MIFYFLKELCASPSRFRLYFFTSCVVIKLSFFVRLNRSGFSFCYSLTFVNFLFVFPAFSLRVSAFSFLRFGSAKVETFFYFPKLFFLFFILSFEPLFLSFLFLLSGLQRYKPFWISENLFEVFLVFIFSLSISLICLQNLFTNLSKNNPASSFAGCKGMHRIRFCKLFLTNT